MKPSTDRTTRLLGWALVAIVSCISPLASCGGGASSKPGEKAGASSPAAAEEPQQDRGTLDPRGKKWGGWRWKGKRDNCFYLVGNQCFDDKEAACQAAGCEPDGCRTDQGAPAKVSCDG